MTEKIDILGQLSDIDPTLTDNPTPEQLYKIYGVYLNVLSNDVLSVDGYTVILNKSKVKDSSKYDRCLLNKQEAFCHIVTRDITKSLKRQFKAERANKIHWIKPILENSTDKRIKYFEGRNSEGQWCRFYWYKERNYIVILKEISCDLLLVTGYCVDLSETAKFNKQWQNYEAQEKMAKKNLPRR